MERHEDKQHQQSKSVEILNSLKLIYNPRARIGQKCRGTGLELEDVVASAADVGGRDAEHLQQLVRCSRPAHSTI
jgi:hypothetical protein